MSMELLCQTGHIRRPPQKEEAQRRLISGETPLLVVSLRAGAGLDGLQKVCRTAVFGSVPEKADFDFSAGRRIRNPLGASYFKRVVTMSSHTRFEIIGSDSVGFRSVDQAFLEEQILLRLTDFPT
jgi:hypothetical protein